ncbi:MAG: NAD(P)-dependent oxidoreductase [Melioribacter sp.]|uniref:NAD-dependent epimerase/dehydratase family protein n=1 Tax=Rosettibacter primus TaxID=3111523 RepID=UPI00247E8681|nr:NAD(P)-dependent oxidoreductase [Melioribacter sp.]
MRYLISGGAGFLGINLIRFLLNNNENDITSIDISEFNYDDVKSKIKIIKGDIRNSSLINDVMKDVDIVIHTAAALPLYSREEIFSIDVEGTKNLLNYAEKYKVKKFIHISSTAVYGIPDHHPIYEEDRLCGVGDYGKAKIEAENICLEFRKQGMCIPILRPKTFIGPERLGVFALLFEWASEGKNFPIIGKGENKYQLLDVEDLCYAIYKCSLLPEKIVNDTFNIGAKNFQSIKEDFQAVLDYANFGKKIITLPVTPAVFLLRIFEKLNISPLYKWIYETINCDSYVSIEKAEKILGFNPKYSNQDALIRNYQWYLNNIEIIKNKKGINHTSAWEQGILKLAKYFF